METRRPKFEWLSLFLLLPLMAILGYLEVHLQIPPAGHILVQIGILLFICFMVNSWITANEAEMRRSQYIHKHPRREESHIDRQTAAEEQVDHHPGLISRLSAIVKPLFHRS